MGYWLLALVARKAFWSVLGLFSTSINEQSDIPVTIESNCYTVSKIMLYVLTISLSACYILDITPTTFQFIG